MEDRALRRPHGSGGPGGGDRAQKKVAALNARFPGLEVAQEGEAFRVVVPDRYRTSHEAHFAEVTERFLGYLEDPKTLPRWEKANMLAKYYVTTKGTELSRQASR